MANTNNVRLFLRLPNEGEFEWRCALFIPIDQLPLFALRPLKWLRYLGYAICGREGTLSATPGGPAVDDTVESIPHDSTQYYFSLDSDVDGIPRFVDPFAIRDRVTTSSAETSRRKDFRDGIVFRDESCVLSGWEAVLCQACHLLPFSKGDTYIKHVIQHRLSSQDLIPRLTSINDLRNGLLLTDSLRTAYVLGLFLKTPNFGLSPGDIPSADLSLVPDHGRLTFQYFIPPSASLQTVIPYNKDARKPQTTEQWPPDFIFDFAYACTALKHWGSKLSVKLVRRAVHQYYYDSPYPNDDESKGSGSKGKPTEEGASVVGHFGPTGGHRMNTRRGASNVPSDREESAEQQISEKARDRGRPTANEEEDYAEIVSFLWMQSSAKDVAAREGKSEADKRERVQAWLSAEGSL